MKMLSKKAIVIHSGGMDSSICLALARNEFGKDQVLSLSFFYDQRHPKELNQAEKICRKWGVEHTAIRLDCLKEITSNALVDHSITIQHEPNQPPNTLVIGRNGLMARIGAIHANHMGAHCIYMGVLGLEGANSGYRDCSRTYMDLMQNILRIDLDDPTFEIRTPLVEMTKKETMDLAHSMGVLDYLLQETITCYEGIIHAGCKKCPACSLRNQGIHEFIKENPNFALPYNI
jgi:7-cyano-7-deazaguanine synthase